MDLPQLALTTLDCLFETDTRQHVSAGLMQRELPLQTNLNIFLSCMETGMETFNFEAGLDQCFLLP